MPFSQKLSQILFPCVEAESAAESAAENGREFSGISAPFIFYLPKNSFLSAMIESIFPIYVFRSFGAA